MQKTCFSSLSVLLPRNNGNKALQQGFFIWTRHFDGQFFALFDAETQERKDAVASDLRTGRFTEHHRVIGRRCGSHEFGRRSGMQAFFGSDDDGFFDH